MYIAYVYSVVFHVGLVLNYRIDTKNDQIDKTLSYLRSKTYNQAKRAHLNSSFKNIISMNMVDNPHYLLYNYTNVTIGFCRTFSLILYIGQGGTA